MPACRNRTYHLADTNEDLPYCSFVSSKVSKDKKNALIVSLRISPRLHVPSPPTPANLAELSEKDVMNVLAIMRKEFNVDPDRRI